MKRVRNNQFKRYEWYNANGEFHRDDGPAIEYYDGTKIWYYNGLKHREYGPAYEDINGDYCWYKHGKYHKINGAAVNYQGTN